MNKCSKCNVGMVRADFYEPEGTMPLYGGIHKDGYWWVCISGQCDDSKKNRVGSQEQI